MRRGEAAREGHWLYTGLGLLVIAAASGNVFRVDRPFLYYIVDDATGAILFQGRVVDPR
jgi:serine protease inhibitor